MNGGFDDTDGMVQQANPHLALDSDDTLFHLGISTDQNLEEKFGDVKVGNCTLEIDFVINTTRLPALVFD